MSAKKNDTEKSMGGNIKRESMAKEMSTAPSAPAPTIKTVVRERKELMAKVDVSADKVIISVDIEVDDTPTLMELGVKGAQADAKIKAVMMQVAKVVSKSTVLTPRTVKIDLLGKKVVLEVGVEPALDSGAQESVRRAI